MKYKIKESIFDVDLDEQKILLDTDSGKYFELNKTSAAIFSLIKDSPKTIEEVIEAISKTFDIVDLDIKAEILDHLRDTFYFRRAD
tara:strand:+ start:1078 stop:1335 length:258 start_codon:yes stop_codon:yes gene_type:complete